MSTLSSVSNKLWIGVGAVAGIGMLSYYYHRYIKQDQMPRKWIRVGTLDKINVFPIKSCAPLTLPADSAVECNNLGTRVASLRDRGLMIVDLENNMITARAYPKLVMVNCEIVAEGVLKVKFEGFQNLLLDLNTIAAKNLTQDVHTAVHGSPVDGMLCGPEYDQWFSQAILGQQTGFKLIYFPFEKPVRCIPARMKNEPYITTKDTGTFNDATSFMLLNLASIADLNTRTKAPVQSLQFRGNFELNMDQPEAYAEDRWTWLKIGDEAVFRVVSPCTRCIFTNINPQNAERNTDREPLQVLKKYRKFEKYNSGPVMGIHLGLRQSGNVKLNDIVYIGSF